MAGIKAILAIILLLFLMTFFHIPKTSSKPASFSLKLIRASHRNNTFRERYKSYVLASKDRAFYWTWFNKSSANKTIHINVIQPPLTNEEERIVVEMSIGTPAQKVFLLLDTGGIRSWTQCASCTTCFPQSTAKFNPELSTTYREMSSDDINCKAPIYIRIGRQCQYQSGYISGQYTKGIASYDTFSSLDNNPAQTASNIRFGCSLLAGGFGFPSNTIISGVLGMSRHPDSFPSQLSQRGGKGRFSYCLVDVNTAPSVVNLVTFGDDIPNTPEGNLQTVPFIEHSNNHHGWFINLLDISVGEERLNLPPGTFARNPNGGNGGLLLDTGSPFTFLTSVAYVGIKTKIQNHLSNTGYFTRISGKSDICYRYNLISRRLLMDYLQTISFHLEDSAQLDLPVTSVYLFNWERKTFCVKMLEAASDWPNILGSLQQQDTRFVYDLNENSLFFKPETCGG